MSVTISTDLTVRHAHDAITNAVGIGGVQAPTSADTTIFVQGTAANRSRANSTGLGGVAGDFTNANIRTLHVLCWVNNLDKVDTKANGGWRIRLAANGASGTAFGEITCGGNDTQIQSNKGFMRICCDPNRPFNFVTGTPAALSGIGSIAVVGNALSASSRETFFCDSYDTATGITVKGGTGADPGKSVQIAANDVSNGRGIFQSYAGAYYILGRITIGDTAASSEFADSNEVWIFQDQPVAASFHRLEFVGDSGAGVNNAKFGTKSGTGTAAEGAGGNTFKAVGEAPFSILAIDSNIAVGLYGCSFINPVALMEDAPRSYQYATAADAFTDETRDAGNATANDFPFMPVTEAVNDKCVIGHEFPFSQVRINVGTAGVGGVVAWEYYNGTSWVALTNVTDGTNSFTTAGTNLVTYSIPADWAATTLNSMGPYYFIRARVTTTYSTNPNGTQIKCLMGGRVRWEQANAEAIRCVFTNMDTIVVRNGALLKKSVISNSVAPAKSAAIDLGGADPAADTVRDLTIQNNINGVLLKGSGNVTYNFRNLKFANNTNDVRVDFGAGDTVTINVLDGGTASPTIQNVNGSTVVISTPATLTVKIVDKDGNLITSACEVTVVKNTDSSILYQAENVTTGSTDYAYSTGAGTVVYINVHNVAGYQNRTLNNHTLATANETVTIQLDDDRYYSNP